MKRTAAIVVAAAASIAAGNAQAQTTCGTVWCSIVETAKKVHTNNCTPGQPSCNFDPVKAGMQGAINAVIASQCANNALTCNLLAAAAAWAIPYPYSISKAGGSTGGGGASGSWQDDPCAGTELGLDADGNLIVPSIGLSTGTAVPPGVGSAFRAGYGTNRYFEGMSYDAVALWSVHTTNRDGAYAGDKLAWQGCYAVTWNGSQMSYDCSSISHWIGSSKIGRSTSNPKPYTWTMGGGFLGCPKGTLAGAGGDTHFYHELAGSTGVCHMYAPSQSLSPSGYIYNWRATVPASVWKTQKPSVYLKGNPFLQCPLSKQFLAKLADEAYKRGAGTAGEPYKGPITEDDVVTGGEDPTVEDLDDTQTAYPSDTGTPTAPNPEPTPTPTPTPTGDDYSHVPTGANEPVAPDIDWWPDLPTVSLSLGSPECPTWDMSVPQFGWELTLDSHCPLVEQNRALISAICVLMFSVGAALIVLRA